MLLGHKLKALITYRLFNGIYIFTPLLIKELQ